MYSWIQRYPKLCWKLNLESRAFIVIRRPFKPSGIRVCQELCWKLNVADFIVVCRAFMRLVCRLANWHSLEYKRSRWACDPICTLVDVEMLDCVVLPEISSRRSKGRMQASVHSSNSSFCCIGILYGAFVDACVRLDSTESSRELQSIFPFDECAHSCCYVHLNLHPDIKRGKL